MTSVAEKKITPSSPRVESMGGGVNDALQSIRQTIQGNLQLKKGLDQHGASQEETVEKEVVSLDVLHLTQDLQVRKEFHQDVKSKDFEGEKQERGVMADKDIKTQDTPPQETASNVFYLTQLLEDDGTITHLDDKKNAMAVSAVDSKKISVADTLTAGVDEVISKNIETESLDLKDSAYELKQNQKQERNMSQDVQNTAADIEFGHIGGNAPDNGDAADNIAIDSAPSVSMPTSAPEAVPSAAASDIASKETLAESAAALGDLAEMARKIQSQPSPQVSEPVTSKNAGDYTVDALMREMLKPLLKDWLDANLPSLVKWIVTEQMEKMLKDQLGVAPTQAQDQPVAPTPQVEVAAPSIEEPQAEAVSAPAEEAMAGFDAPGEAKA